MSESSPLYIAVHDKIDAINALKKVWAISEEKPFLLVYSPDFCCFATLEDEKIVSLTEKENQRDASVFEFRCFCEEYELRWVREGSEDIGKAVLISERNFEIDGFEHKTQPYDVFPRSGQYLLWGKNNGTGNDETILFDHRVGSLRVPIKTRKNSRVYLHFREYFTKDEYGNLALKAERCLALKE